MMNASEEAFGHIRSETRRVVEVPLLAPQNGRSKDSELHPGTEQIIKCHTKSKMIHEKVLWNNKRSIMEDVGFEKYWTAIAENNFQLHLVKKSVRAAFKKHSF